MAEIENLIKDIEKLRKNLEALIEQKKGNLLDSDVQFSSRMLNTLIVEYNKIVEEKLKQE